MTDDRYIVVEIPGGIPEPKATNIAEALIDTVADLGDSYSVDLFVFRPHTQQEQVLHELFGEKEDIDDENLRTWEADRSHDD